MSGSASVTNTFQSQSGAIPLSQLDTNFTGLTNFLNDPTNRYNYVADTGITNTISATFVPAVLGYTAGLTISFKAANTNSGSVAININSIGTTAYVHADLTSLLAGEIAAGGIYRAIFDGTQFIHVSTPSPATAAQVSAAVTVVPFVSPGRMQNHPGVAKAWVTWTGTATGTVTAADSYNVASVVRLGTGTYSIAFTTSFADTAYPIVINAASGGVGGAQSGTRLVSGLKLLTVNSSTGAPIDINELVSFIAYGNQ